MQPVARAVPNVGSYTFNPSSLVVDVSGSYRAAVLLNAEVFGASSPFSLDSCAVKTCNNGGICSSGVCQCAVGYSGATCQISICDGISCNSGVCVASTGVCDCDGTAGFTGARCEIPPSCTFKCSVRQQRDLCTLTPVAEPWNRPKLQQRHGYMRLLVTMVRCNMFYMRFAGQCCCDDAAREASVLCRLPASKAPLPRVVISACVNSRTPVLFVTGFVAACVDISI